MNARTEPTLTLEEARMEPQRPDGLRPRIRPTRGMDMLALVGRFMGA